MVFRTVGLPVGTIHDIQHICSSMEQLFLSYKSGEVPYIYIANLLELLFQSARTRICVLRRPDSNGKYDNVYSIEELDKLVVFATFRKRETYRTFLEMLSRELHSDSEKFLEEECERLGCGTECFYICLARVYPEDNNKVVIGWRDSKEAYHRLTTLLCLLVEDANAWGIDIPTALYTCFDKVPDGQNSICKLSPSVAQLQDAPDATGFMGDNPSSHMAWNEKLLKPIEQWIEYVYEQNHDIPLLRVAQPGHPGKDMGFSNLFFFMRINDVRGKHDRADEHFKVKLVCPPQQRKEFSKFYHHHRGDQCQWHEGCGECRISGMEKCLLQPFWDKLPESVTDEETIATYYAPLWEQLTASSNANFSKSETAFRSSSIIFDRRRKQPLQSGGKGVVSGVTERDSISACITFRMMSPNSASQNMVAAEDRVPQLMYVPIYAGASPFLLAGTVVNAQLPEPHNRSLSEWRRAYHFAGMIFQSMASRLKESARKAYLNKATDLIQGFYEAYRSKVEDPPYCDIGAEELFLEYGNKALDDLSKIYPYHKIILAKATKDVIKRKGRDVFVTPEGIALQVSLERNPYWRSFSERPFISVEHAARKFSSGIARSVAFSEKEKREWQAFFFWHYKVYKVPPYSKKGWREYASRIGWDGEME